MRRRVPKSDGRLHAGRSEGQTIRTERYAAAGAGVSVEAEQLRMAGRRVPNMHGLAFASRGDEPAVRAEGDALNESSRMLERVETPAGRRIPQVHAAADAGHAPLLPSPPQRQRAPHSPPFAPLSQRA